jgi:hypothetical protein
MMQQARSARGPRGLGEQVGKLAGAVMRRRGFAVAEVLLRWPAIVGATLAEQTCPERLGFPTGKADEATLRLRVAPGFAPEVQHLAPLIVERINTFYGYRAVARLKIVQGPLPARRQPAAPAERPLGPDEEARLHALTTGIADAELRAALERLGRSLLAAAPAA